MVSMTWRLAPEMFFRDSYHSGTPLLEMGKCFPSCQGSDRSLGVLYRRFQAGIVETSTRPRDGGRYKIRRLGAQNGQSSYKSRQ